MLKSTLRFFKSCFFVFIFLSCPLFLIKNDVFAATNIRFDSFSPCYNSRTYVGDWNGEGHTGTPCYDGNWRVRYRISNSGNTGDNVSVQYFTVPLELDYDYGFDSDYFYLGPSSYRDVNRTISARLCLNFILGAYPQSCDETNPTYFGGSCDPHYWVDAISQNVEDIPQCQAITPTPTIAQCQTTASQESGSLTLSIGNSQSAYYVSFTPSFSGTVDEVEVKAGNWGSAARSITCRVKNSTGTQNVSAALSSPTFTDASGADWRTINYTGNPFSITSGTGYRLYCWGPESWGSIYWVYGQVNNPESKTYRICARLQPGPTSTPTLTPTQTLTPTITPTPTTIPGSAWFQAQGGNIYANGNISDLVPQNEYLTTDARDTIGGIIASAGITYYDEAGSLNVGSGESGKNANSASFPEITDYEAFYRRFAASTVNELTASDLTVSDLGDTGSLGNTRVFKKVGNTTLSDSSWNSFSGNAVIFIEGTLTIDTDVLVDDGSFLAFVVQDSINVTSDVGVAPTSTTTSVEGFYYTDGIFSTGSSTSGKERLNLGGTFIAGSGFNLERDLGGSYNATTPAETFSFRPDFSFSAPTELLRPYRFFQEINP